MLQQNRWHTDSNMRVTALITLLVCAAFAQSSAGIATSVSRTVTVAPDKGDFTVVITTSLILLNSR